MRKPEYIKILFLLMGMMLLETLAADPECDDIVCVYDERKGDDVYIYTQNNSAFDITIELELILENMRQRGDKQSQFVVTANSKFRLAKLRPINDREVANYHYSTSWVRGNVNAKHDEEALYQLPFETGNTHYVTQSCDGGLSHTGDYTQYAIDFAMPVGTKIYAARSGRVVDLHEVSISGGGSPLHYDDANYVQLVHDDGTIGGYFHLRTMGVKVNVGDEIDQGQFIGISGDTGFASGPHLHFHVQKPKSGKGTVSVPIRWKAARGIVSCPRAGLALKSVSMGE